MKQLNVFFCTNCIKETQNGGVVSVQSNTICYLLMLLDECDEIKYWYQTWSSEYSFDSFWSSVSPTLHET
jgi:hypothetical protein